ncbi:MAG: hypothetical protein V4520_09985 [Bacteroidota bacterium]
MKKLYLLLFTIFISLSAKTQSLYGNYISNTPAGSIEMSFWGNKFSQIIIDNNTGKTHGEGVFELKDGKLILNFGKQEPDTSEFKMVLDNSRDPKIMHLSITILDKKG